MSDTPFTDALLQDKALVATPFVVVDHCRQMERQLHRMMKEVNALWPERIECVTPKRPGYYWWRETPDCEWIIVKAETYDESGEIALRDLSKGSFSGRGSETWQKLRRVGQWQWIRMPEETK